MSTRTKARVLMIGCGGTIGMVPGEDGTLHPAHSVDEIVKYIPGLTEHAEIQFLQLMNKDSTNMGPEDWTSIALAIKENVADCQGVILTHGTDTMAYTASALSFAFGRSLTVPIILTGSQLPVISFPTDATFNLQVAFMAMEQAIDIECAEVMVAFSDMVMRGNRTIKQNEVQFRAFDSPAFQLLGRVSAMGVEFSPFIFKRQSSQLEMKPHFHPNVVTVELTPGFPVDSLISMVKDGKCRGILLKSLGAGNVPDSWMSTLEWIIKTCQIPILVSTQFVGGRTQLSIYELGKKAMDIGVIPTRNMTTSAATVKLMWLLANGCSTIEQIREGIETSIVGEID